jgi:hypothetical protein
LVQKKINVPAQDPDEPDGKVSIVEKILKGIIILMRLSAK